MQHGFPEARFDLNTLVSSEISCDTVLSLKRLLHSVDYP
jgi:hypothetical protein